MTNSLKPLALAALMTSFSLIPTAAHTQSMRETRAASALLGQFETVAYSTTDILRGSEPSGANDAADSAHSLRSPFLELIAALRFLGPGTETDFELSYNAILVGATDFAGPVGLGPGPQGLGMVNSRKCYVAVLGDGAEPDFESDFKNALKKSIGGLPTSTWKVPQYEGSPQSTTFYAVQIFGSYLVLANNIPDLEHVVGALTTPAESVQAPANVLNWNTFSTYPFWAYRQFRRSGVKYPNESGLKGLRQDVAGIIFFANVQEGIGFVQVFSSNSNLETAPPILKKLGPEEFHLLNGGVWQAKVALSKDQAGVDTIFEIFYRLGFGMAL